MKNRLYDNNTNCWSDKTYLNYCDRFQTQAAEQLKVIGEVNPPPVQQFMQLGVVVTAHQVEVRLLS